MAKGTKKTHAKEMRVVAKKEQPKASSGQRSPRKIKMRSLLIGGAALLALILIALALWRYLIVATVNGQPIDRFSYNRELEKQAGKQVMNNLVTKALILQEARKQNMNVSSQEIDDEIKKIESNLSKQGQKLEQVLSFQGMSKDDLREQLKYQKLIQKMVGKDVKVTDKEINDYIDKNKSSFPENAKPEEMKSTARKQLYQQKLNDKIRVWLENLQKKAKVNYNVRY